MNTKRINYEKQINFRLILNKLKHLILQENDLPPPRLSMKVIITLNLYVQKYEFFDLFTVKQQRKKTDRESEINAYAL